MASNTHVESIAIVGTGTIGASWATHYLAHGFDVVATDPAPGAEVALRAYVDEAWDGAATLGPGARRLARSRCSSPPTCARRSPTRTSCRRNAPERPELKVKLFADIDDATPADAIIASSSSGITMSEIQAECSTPSGR